MGSSVVVNVIVILNHSYIFADFEHNKNTL